MKTKSIGNRIKEIVAEQLALPEEDIKNDSHFIDDLGADSLDIVELIMTMEEEFELEIPDDDAEKMLTIQDVIQYVSSKLSPSS